MNAVKTADSGPAGLAASSPGSAEEGARPRVAVVFGGRSSEHAISCVTANCVMRAIDPEEFAVIPVGITRDGRWVQEEDRATLAIADGRLPSVSEEAAGLVLAGDPTVGGLLPLGAGNRPAGPGSVRGLDVVFPVLHGPFGEDGTIQGLLELAGIPYVGSGVLPSAVAMDKEYAKRILADVGLEVGAYRVVRPGDWRDDPEGVCAAVADHLGWPVFVKPARAGSSMGISKVRGPEGLAAAIEDARRHDPKVIVEGAVAGRELECGVLEGEAGSAPDASLPAEVRVGPGFEFYDFEAKYLDDALALDIPPAVDPVVVKEVQRQSVCAFEALSCAGLARVDFFVRGDGTVLVNEVNTMPGFTPTSAFPRMWEASGLPYPALVRRLLRTALAAGAGLH